MLKQTAWVWVGGVSGYEWISDNLKGISIMSSDMHLIIWESLWEC